jgi:AraC family transcriptional regulator of adaptative response/methylated-DNA-[protein]-cysteine methyltransferase
VDIRYVVGQCSLGWAMVAATERGVCAIELGESPDNLLTRLRARFPKAHLTAGDASFAGTVRQVMALLETPGRGLDLPLDIQGTAFQRRVWDALRQIPSGHTASYAAVAARIGQPSAIRAVAQACAANSLAVAIPCHRVVRGALLEREAAPATR